MMDWRILVIKSIIVLNIERINLQLGGTILMESKTSADYVKSDFPNPEEYRNTSSIYILKNVDSDTTTGTKIYTSFY